jgi:nitroreductase
VAHPSCTGTATAPTVSSPDADPVDPAPDDVTPVTRPAPVDHPVIDVIAGRWSARAIDPDEPVAHAVLLRVLEAARWAPSWGNAQPWRYLVFDDRVPRAREQARDCLSRGNAWARNAPVLLLAVASTVWPDSDEPHPSAAYDTGAASMALCLQAQAEGLVVHQLGGFDHERARTSFSLPPHTEPLAMIAVGHPGDVGLLDERARQKERRARRRRPVEAFARLGGWDGPPVDGTSGDA